MTQGQIATYHGHLLALLRDLAAGRDLGADATHTVTLDQQSVGRLSRMDALQQQAMAKATQARRGTAERRITAALARIAEGEFGICTECGEEIAARRLDLDPTVPTCITCAR
ncbi:MAG: TraR/DksA C4-type zinc finger protein [Rhodobacteraceae bacterium]|nr:TraR/DksA C4-type zinc finger protein [Paracoccaceae bacterium]